MTRLMNGCYGVISLTGKDLAKNKRKMLLFQRLHGKHTSKLTISKKIKLQDHVVAYLCFK